MTQKLGWGDIGGGAKPRPGISPPWTATPTEVEESPVNFVDKANELLDGGVEMIKKIDKIVGFLMDLYSAKKGGRIIEAESATEGPTGHLAPGNPGPQVPETDALLALLDRIIEAEGDIPLSKLLAGIKNQEAWLVKYAVEIAKGQSTE